MLEETTATTESRTYATCLEVKVQFRCATSQLEYHPSRPEGLPARISSKLFFRPFCAKVGIEAIRSPPNWYQSESSSTKRIFFTMSTRSGRPYNNERQMAELTLQMATLNRKLGVAWDRICAKQAPIARRFPERRTNQGIPFPRGNTPASRSEFSTNRSTFQERGSPRTIEKGKGPTPQATLRGRNSVDCDMCGGRGHLADICPNRDQCFALVYEGDEIVRPSETSPSSKPATPPSQPFGDMENEGSNVGPSETSPSSQPATPSQPAGSAKHEGIDDVSSEIIPLSQPPEEEEDEGNNDQDAENLTVGLEASDLPCKHAEDLPKEFPPTKDIQYAPDLVPGSSLPKLPAPQLKHKPDVEHRVTDTLSQKSHVLTLLTSEMIRLEKLKTLYSSDAWFQPISTEVSAGNRRQHPKFSVRSDFLFQSTCLCVPKPSLEDHVIKEVPGGYQNFFKWKDKPFSDLYNLNQLQHSTESNLFSAGGN